MILSMIFFWICIISFAFCLLFTLFYPRSTIKNHSENTLNQQLYQQQLTNIAHLASPLKQHLEKEIHYRFFLQDTQNKTNLLSLKKPNAWLLLSVGIIIIGIILSGYLISGRYQLVLNEEQKFQQAMETRQQQNRQHTDYILAIQNKLRTNPNDGDSWFELGQAYTQNNEYPEALECYSRALKLNGRKAYLLSAIANTLYYQANSTLTDEVRQYLAETLALNPQDTTALLLLASEAFQQQHYTQAITYWKKVLDNAQSVDRVAIIQNIQIAEELEKHLLTPVK